MKVPAEECCGLLMSKIAADAAVVEVVPTRKMLGTPQP